MSSLRTFSASWVAPVTSPPIRDGIVSVSDGKIVYVGDNDDRNIHERFDSAIIIPGLVNAHTHLDLTGAKNQVPPRLPFTDWLKGVIAYRNNKTDSLSEIQDGLRLCLEAGTTLIGDISHKGISFCYVAQQNELRSVSFFELIGVTRNQLQSSIDDWMTLKRLDFILDNDRHRLGISPHAPYSVNSEGLRMAVQESYPLAIHLAGSAEEKEFVENRRGPFVEFLESLGIFEPVGLVTSWNEVFQIIEKAASPLIIHANYLSTNDPIPTHATIVYCPRTHAAFEHPPHPFRDFLSHGLQVVLGTDSLASNPDLSILNEARFVSQRYPDFDPSTLLHMITDWPAFALGFGERCGSLSRGKYADLCVVELPPTNDPLRTLFSEATPIRAVYIGGVRVV